MLAGVGSAVALLMVAVLTMGPTAATVTLIVQLALVAGASVPMFQVNVLPATLAPQLLET